MTTEELAECLGVAKQTVNRWIREKGWKTEKFPGVKGGRARLILVDTQVCEFIQNTPAFHIISHSSAAPSADIEQEKVAQFLSREGIRNFLARLDIDESA